MHAYLPTYIHAGAEHLQFDFCSFSVDVLASSLPASFVCSSVFVLVAATDGSSDVVFSNVDLSCCYVREGEIHVCVCICFNAC